MGVTKVTGYQDNQRQALHEAKAFKKDDTALSLEERWV